MPPRAAAPNTETPKCNFKCEQGSQLFSTLTHLSSLESPSLSFQPTCLKVYRRRFLSWDSGEWKALAFTTETSLAHTTLHPEALATFCRRRRCPLTVPQVGMKVNAKHRRWSLSAGRASYSVRHEIQELPPQNCTYRTPAETCLGQGVRHAIR